MDTKEKSSKKTMEATGHTEKTENNSQKTENAGGRGNGLGIDFDKLVADSHTREAENNHIPVEEKKPYWSPVEEKKDSGERDYKPYSVFPKGMVKQIAAFPFAGIDNVFRPFYPGMPSFYLTESESAELAEPLDMVLWEYSPVLLSQYGSLVTLGFGMVMMVIRKSGWGRPPKKIIPGPDEETIPGDAAGFEESPENAS